MFSFFLSFPSAPSSSSSSQPFLPFFTSVIFFFYYISFLHTACYYRKLQLISRPAWNRDNWMESHYLALKAEPTAVLPAFNAFLTSPFGGSKNMFRDRKQKCSTAAVAYFQCLLFVIFFLLFSFFSPPFFIYRHHTSTSLSHYQKTHTCLKTRK